VTIGETHERDYLDCRGPDRPADLFQCAKILGVAPGFGLELVIATGTAYAGILFAVLMTSGIVQV
jgi:hypothetical protein